MKEIFDLINTVKLSKTAIMEGSEPPTLECRSKSIEVANYLYSRYRLIPDYISAIPKNGILLNYSNNHIEFYVQIHNNLDIIAILSNMKESTIICNHTINNKEFNFDNIINEYRKDLKN